MMVLDESLDLKSEGNKAACVTSGDHARQFGWENSAADLIKPPEAAIETEMASPASPA
jgi:hypothetical protein